LAGDVGITSVTQDVVVVWKRMISNVFSLKNTRDELLFSF
jgi:hypothetical protein